MTDRNTLLSLADNYEAANGFDPALDRKLQEAVYEDSPILPPEYSRSLDTAVSLIPSSYIQPSDIMHDALDRLREHFSLHIMHWPLITPYNEWLARFVTAASLRALAHASTGDTE